MSCALFRSFLPKDGIYVVNRSTVVTDDEVKLWCAALRIQIKNHVVPVWGLKNRTVRFVNKHSHAPYGTWVITVLDDADQEGALGYHTMDDKGRVYGRVFAKTCLDYGIEPSTTFSHEVLETFGDPAVSSMVRVPGKNYSVPLELCDAVEGGSYPILVKNTRVDVSNFLWPAWFGMDQDPMLNNVCDEMHTTKAPFTLAPGGYTIREWTNGKVDQQFGRKASKDYIAAKASNLSRTARIRKYRGE